MQMSPCLSQFCHCLLRTTCPVFCLLMLLAASAQADHSVIRYATVEEHPGSATFYLDVLNAALERTTHSYALEHVGEVPQVRAQSLLQSGALDIFWMVMNPDRDARYLTTGVGISGGLVGQRILMIRPQDQALFDGVETLEEFRDLDLTVGFGRGWVDSFIWDANDLNVYEEEGSWQVIFDKLKRNRGDFDYLSRSVKELPGELQAYPELVAEQNLMLVYDRDETFYISPENESLRDDLSTALRAIRDDGTIEDLVREYWGDNLSLLNVDNRRVIELYTPPLHQ